MLRVNRHVLIAPFVRRRVVMTNRAALFSFGVIADVQYADKESKCSGSRPECVMNYRNAFPKLENAVQEFTKRSTELAFVINLGDVIDGNADPERTMQDFEKVIGPFNQLKGAVEMYHVIGNHCLRVPSGILLERLEMPHLYYACKIHQGWKLIVLNSNDLGFHAEGEAQLKETEAFLKKFPIDSHPCVQKWNGGIAAQQIQWLKNELNLAKASDEKVIIGCHHPIGKASARETHMAWNAAVIESIIVESGVVALVMSGHDHVGGYNQINNTHFLTLPGVIEAPDELEAFGVVHVYADTIMIEGHGMVQTQKLDLMHHMR